jgi:hypothetical protein
MLVEGPEIVVPVVESSSVVVASSTAAAAVASSAAVVATTAAAPAATSAAVVATSAAVVATSAVVVAASSSVVVAPASSAAVVASSVAAKVNATASSSTAPVVASSSVVAVVTTPKPTVHPDNYNATVSFLMHSGKCSDAYSSSTQANMTKSAKTQIATALAVHEDSMSTFTLNCSGGSGVNATGIHTMWTQTPQTLNGTTVKLVVQKLKDMLKNGTLKIVLNSNNMTLAKEATTDTIVPPTPPPTTPKPTTPEPTLAPENYVNDVTFTLHTGNCTDVFTDNKTPVMSIYFYKKNLLLLFCRY